LREGRTKILGVITELCFEKEEEKTEKEERVKQEV
jgi:hypothetical protein